MDQPAVVRAKVTVDERKEMKWNPSARELTMRCVHASEIPEDQKFSQATPSGHITLLIDNPAALEKLPMGKTFYVDFIPAD